MFFLVLFLSIGFFGLGFVSRAIDSVIVINEIYPNTDNESDEFVELKNTSNNSLDISGWAIKDATSVSSHKTTFPVGTILSPGEYFFIKKNLYLNNDNDTVYLLDKAGIEKDNRRYDNAPRGKSYSLDGGNWKWTFPTMGLENEFDAPEVPLIEEDGVSGKAFDVYLNEILPNPSGKGEEYIEIFNDSGEEVDLAGWILKDASKTGKYVFPGGSVLKSEDLLVVYKKDFKFAMNDSGTEAVHLLDPNEKEVSQVNYSGAKDGISYNFTGSKWRWSKHLTPGAENIFDDEPDFKIKKDEKIYKNFPANFDVNIKKYKKSKYKITWNFGDGHKSYKKDTTHKYKKNGKYSGSVKIFNGSEEVVKTFKVEVKSFPKYDVEIISVVPNPPGRDSDFETVTIRNNSKKKINLQNWSVATGDKKLINHPIALKTVLKPKQTLQINRQMSKFTLNNQKAKVELRYPNGKVASKMAYDKKAGNIVEGEILEKSKLGWVWKNTAPVADVSQDPNVSQETSLLAVAPKIGENLERPQILGESTIKEELWGGQSERSPKKDYRVLLAGFIYSQFNEGVSQSSIRPVIDLASLFL